VPDSLHAWIGVRGQAARHCRSRSFRKQLYGTGFQNNKTRLKATRTVSISTWGHGRHGASWMAYDISFSGDVCGGAVRSAGTGRWN
jgi:hypothetical protein